MNNIKRLVKICDVTLRDGIQGLKSSTNLPIFSHSQKLHIMNRLDYAKIDRIEFGSNVSSKLIEMSNTKDVVTNLSMFQSHNDAKLYLLLPSYKKYLEVCNWSNYYDYVTHNSLITACSESFVKKNTNMNLEESWAEIDKILTDSNKKARIYISTCFGCPIEGSITKLHIHNMEKIFNKYSSNPKVDEIVISDTIGTYDMKQLSDYMKLFASTNKVSLHIHSTSEDKNIPEIINMYKNNIVAIDTSMGNIGGCPNVEKQKIKPNLSTLKIATIINDITGENIYNLAEIRELESLVANKIMSNN